MRSLLLLVFSLVSVALSAQHYYVAGSHPGLVVGLADAPNLPERFRVALPLSQPPTAQAQAMAQASLDRFCSSSWEVALTNDPDVDSGYADLWVVRRVSDGWRPSTRLTVGGMLINDGLVSAPVGCDRPLQDVYDQAFTNAVAYKAGWFQQLGPDGGRNAWIVGKARVVQHLQLEQMLASKAQDDKRAQDADAQRELRRALKTASPAESKALQEDYLRKKGYKVNWKTLRVSPLNAPDDDD
ncbi:hypothetical protein [Geothrix sp. PMB-07]|uniref:hypothetical protein n=1 Tax=Geothrix sp. PMB-07 TaxID=3068640 RepID=UPI002740D6CE|nr:hypothetical protein [Geothrix sp. PMB-07]WLT30633.1 hypothetical protein Q9293_13005 [Geothrix sp. PMB-07]